MDEQDYAKHISGIRTENFKQSGFRTTDDIWDISGLKNINFFIGQNNSGKSRLLRYMITRANYDIKVADINHIDLIDKIILNAKNDELFFDNGLRSSFLSTIDEQSKTKITVKNLKKTIETIIENQFHKYQRTLNSTDFSNFMNQFYIKYLKVDNFDFYEKVSLDGFKKIYIPLLRGLRPLTKDSDLYQSRTNNDYFQGITGKNFEIADIFTGHTIYKEIKSALLGTHINRVKVREFEKYLSNNFFNSNEITLIPRIDEDMVYLKEGEKEERRIADLGDGLQSIIILTFKVFMADVPTAFFIDEAEQHLHPGMQRTLISAFTKHPQHMFFITTHSNHFVDIAQELDCVSLNRVYQQIEDGMEVSYVDSLSEKSEMLADLGVRASSVLLANCSIWVEGITDKLYISAFMSKYIDELTDNKRAEKLRNYKENLHYIFTEYQGSNITHWDFSNTNQTGKNQTKAKSLTSNILLIADRDIEGKADRVANLENNLLENFLLLDFKEIENHIPAIIVEKTADIRWKTFNKKGDAEFEILDLTQSVLHVTEGIGSILERYVSKNSSERFFFKDKSGTIKDKVKFCHTAISIMRDPETEWELTPELKTYCKQIWDHIEKCNPK